MRIAKTAIAALAAAAMVVPSVAGARTYRTVHRTYVEPDHYRTYRTWDGPSYYTSSYNYYPSYGYYSYPSYGYYNSYPSYGYYGSNYSGINVLGLNLGVNY